MSKMLYHRGPDYDGVWVSEEKTIALINTRLSIVDSTNKFAVPYISNSCKSVLTYNGEIYNYKELSNYLSSQGVLLKVMNRATNINSYYVAQVPGGVYRESISLNGGKIVDNRKALKSLGQDNLMDAMIQEQYK